MDLESCVAQQSGKIRENVNKIINYAALACKAQLLILIYLISDFLLDLNLSNIEKYKKLTISVLT